jgi:hypothetical protein
VRAAQDKDKAPPAGVHAARGMVMFLAKHRKKAAGKDEKPEEGEDELQPRAPKDEDERDYMQTLSKMAQR